MNLLPYYRSRSPLIAQPAAVGVQQDAEYDTTVHRRWVAYDDATQRLQLLGPKDTLPVWVEGGLPETAVL